MPRYEANKSNVVYAPTSLSLRTNGHRSSLDGNEVSLLSGRDPRAIGMISRMPGGRQINGSNFFSESSVPHHARFYQRHGVHGGHMFRTTTTSSFVPPAAAATATVDVVGVQGLSAGEYVAIWGAANTFVGRVNSISGNTLTLGGVDNAVFHDGNGGGSAVAIASGATVVRSMAMPMNGNLPSSSGWILGMNSLCDLQIGQSCILLGTRDGSNAFETMVIADMNVSSNRVTFTTGTTKVHSGVVALVPVESSFAYSEMMIAQAGGNVEMLTAGAYKRIWDASTLSLDTTLPWQTTLYDRSVLAVNGKDRPRRITAQSSAFNPAAAGQQPPTAYVGFPPDPGVPSSLWSSTGTGVVTSGTHRMMVRLIDASVVPECKSGPLCSFSLSCGASKLIQLDVANLFFGIPGLYQNGFIGLGNNRATHMEIWMTTAGGTTYFLASRLHLSGFLGSDALFSGARQINLSDEDLVAAGRDVLLSDDITKGRMPNGKFVHHSQGVTFVAGKTDAGAANEYPRVLSGNIVYHSRVDTTEPENFPATNYALVGNQGDEVRGFVDAAPCTLILTLASYTVVQRAAGFIIFDDADDDGTGLAYEEAYCTLGGKAVWVSDEAIYLFDGNTKRATNIGEPIRDWILGLASATRVRVGYDAVHKVVWVGKIVSDTLAECRLYNLADGSWVAREDCALDAPCTAYGMEAGVATRHLYRFGGPDGGCFRAVDYDLNPLIDGGYTLNSTDQFIGTLVAGLSGATTITGLSGLPATNTLRGVVVRFSSTDTRIITANTTSSITWATPLTVAAGTTWIIGCIPFRLRFPPIRGQDPFTDKIARGAQFVLDRINYGNQSAQDASLGISVVGNFQDIYAGGRVGSIALKSGVATVGRDFAADVQCTGQILELNVGEAARHVGFALIYAGLNVYIPGVMGGDRSTTV